MPVQSTILGTPSMSDAGVGLVSVDKEGLWRGGRYYLHHLVRSVTALEPARRLPLYDVAWGAQPKDDAFAEVRPLLSGSRLIAPPQAIGARLRRRFKRAIARQSDARDLFARAGVGALFPISPCENPGVPLVFWLSDFQYRRLPELFTEDMRAWFQRQFDTNVARARLVVLSSRDAFEDFCEFYPAHRAKARILRFCSTPDPEWFALDPASAAKARGLTGPYLIACNQFARHKNYESIFEAMRRLRDAGENVRLVCTGSAHSFHGPGYFEDLQRYLAKHRLEDAVRCLGLVPRAEQIALMRGAQAVLQPSRFEGWSTIVEDAKTLGKTVLASDIAVHREQLREGGGGLVATNNVEAWSAAIRGVLANPEAAPRGAAEIHVASETRARATGRAFVEIMREASA
jgi:glycosyltransferase involved in cell wall biosynthesis